MFKSALSRAKRAFRPSSISKTFASSALEESAEQYCPGGYHPMYPGMTLNNRYTVKRKLGFGQHSTVWLATDGRGTKSVAIKILTASRSQDPDLEELRLLNLLRNADALHCGFSHVLTPLDFFRLDGPNGNHLCLVTELMGMDLTTLQRGFEGGKLPMHLAMQVARQMLLGLDFIHQHGIIHCSRSKACAN